MSAGATGRILDSANLRVRNITVGCARRSVDEREPASITRGHKLLGGNRGNLRVQEFR